MVTDGPLSMKRMPSADFDCQTTLQENRNAPGSSRSKRVGILVALATSIFAPEAEISRTVQLMVVRPPL